MLVSDVTIEDEGPPAPLDDAVVIEALSDESLREVVVSCTETERSVKEISEVTDIPLASAYRYVRNLVDDGILVRSRSAISPDGKRYDLYRSRVRRAVLEVSPDGVNVAWYANEEVEERLARLWDELRSEP